DAADAGPDAGGGVLDPVDAVVPGRVRLRCDRRRQKAHAVRLRRAARVAVAAHARLDALVVVGAGAGVVVAEDRPVAARTAAAVARVRVARGFAAAHDLDARARVRADGCRLRRALREGAPGRQ